MIYLFSQFYSFVVVDKSVLTFFSSIWFGETFSFRTGFSKRWGFAYLKSQKPSDDIFRPTN